MYSGNYSEGERKGEWFQLYSIGFGGIPGRPIGDGPDGHSLWPSFVNIPCEYLESYYPLRVEAWETVSDTGGAGLHRGGNAVDVAYRFLEPGTIAIHDDRWLTYPWGVNGGDPGARGRKWIDRVDGTTEILPSKIHDVEVAPGDVLHFVTWGGGGWGDPLARDPELVGLEVRRGLVTADGARRYGVVCDGSGTVDVDATASLRAGWRPGAPTSCRRSTRARRWQRSSRGARRRPGSPPPTPGGPVTGVDDDAFPPALGVDFRVDARAGRSTDAGVLRRRLALCLPSSDVLGPARRVLDAARAAGVPVVHTRVAYDADGTDGGVFLRKVPALRASSEGAAERDLEAVAPPGGAGGGQAVRERVLRDDALLDAGVPGVDTVLVAGSPRAGASARRRSMRSSTDWSRSSSGMPSPTGRRARTRPTCTTFRRSTRRSSARPTAIDYLGSVGAEEADEVEIVEVAPRDGLQNERSCCRPRPRPSWSSGQCGRRPPDRGDQLRQPHAGAADGRRRRA